MASFYNDIGYTDIFIVCLPAQSSRLTMSFEDLKGHLTALLSNNNYVIITVAKLCI